VNLLSTLLEIFEPRSIPVTLSSTGFASADWVALGLVSVFFLDKREIVLSSDAPVFVVK